MKKSDLKTGMIAKLRDGSLNLVIINGTAEDAMIDIGKEEDKGRFLLFSDIKEDMTHRFSNLDYLDVMCVSKCTGPYGYLVDEGFREIIWERPTEKPIVTLDGVEYSESTLRSLIKKATS